MSECLKEQVLESDCLGSDPGSRTDWLLPSGLVTWCPPPQDGRAAAPTAVIKQVHTVKRSEQSPHSELPIEAHCPPMSTHEAQIKSPG